MHQCRNLVQEIIAIRSTCRRSISEIKHQFPGVDFSLIESDEDVLWKDDEREDHNVMRVRSDTVMMAFQPLTHEPVLPTQS